MNFKALFIVIIISVDDEIHIVIRINKIHILLGYKKNTTKKSSNISSFSESFHQRTTAITVSD